MTNQDSNTAPPSIVWLEPGDVHVPERLRAAVGEPALVAEILARRGILDAGVAHAFLDPDEYLPSPPGDLPGLEVAVDRLEQALSAGESVCVWGDFDVDGQTATALLVATLNDLGAAPVRYHIPIRATESHGVNLPRLRELIDEGTQLLLTCDTGIAAHEAVAYARQRGVDVVITDHHDLPASLPSAMAVVNPKLLDPGHPLATLPGVGVAFKVAEALYQRAGRPEELAQHLDLVALGIVADLAVQKADTRYLLQRGLEVLRRTPREGLRAMFELAGLDPAGLTEEHIGYVLGPRLNALGRLADANLAVEFLTGTDAGRARVLATELEGLNARRKMLTDQVFQAARSQIESDPSSLVPPLLVLAHPAWEPGVLGIVASRLVEHYHRPVILLATPPGELARGSARSVDGVDISQAIARQANLLEAFGGHPMAAGLSLYPERIPELRRGLAREVRAMTGGRPASNPLQLDAQLPLAELTFELAQALERLAPFGPGNPAPVLVARGMRILRAASVGRQEDHRLVTVVDEADESRQLIWWGGAGWPLPAGRFDLAYRVRTSTYRGEQSLQIEWLASRPAADEPDVVELPTPAIVIEDHRRDADPHAALQDLLASGGVQVWCEAEARNDPGGSDRRSLSQAARLAIWTVPPGPLELAAALEAVSPQRVYLFAEDPDRDDLKGFLERLAGLARYALRARGGQLDLADLASAMAHSLATVEAGVVWLKDHGDLTILEKEAAIWKIGAGDGLRRPDLEKSTAMLKSLLAETAAYRAFYKRAEPHDILQGQ